MEYYGEIPKNIDKVKLQSIMQVGLVKYFLDSKLYFENKYELYNHLVDILDNWFNEDFENENKFDYLVTGDDTIEFFNSTISNVIINVKN